MTEYLAAAVGSAVGVALGIIGAAHLWHRSELRAAARREAMRRHPSSYQASPYARRKAS